MSEHRPPPNSFAHRLWADLCQLLILGGYFYVAFIALAFYKATILHAYGIRYEVWGSALIKAILMAKFALIGRSVTFGASNEGTPLVKPIFYKSFALLALLLTLTGLEQFVTGLVQRHSLRATLHALTAGGGEKLAEVLILFLVLTPLATYSVAEAMVGTEVLEFRLFGLHRELSAGKDCREDRPIR